MFTLTPETPNALTPWGADPFRPPQPLPRVKTAPLLFASFLASALLVPALSAAASAPPSVPGPADLMFAEYFRAETARLAEASLADIRTLEDWKARRATYREQLLEMLGLSPLPERTDLKPAVTGRVEHAEFTVEKLHFQSLPGLYVTANLYVPRALGGKKAPAILYACGHAVAVSPATITPSGSIVGTRSACACAW